MPGLTRQPPLGRIEHMFDMVSTGSVSGSPRRAPGGVSRGHHARPWLGENSGFEATVEATPGGPGLAHFLSTLLTLTPASVGDSPTSSAGSGGPAMSPPDAHAAPGGPALSASEDWDPDASPVPPWAIGAAVEVPGLPDWVDALDRFSEAGHAFATTGRVPEEPTPSGPGFAEPSPPAPSGRDAAADHDATAADATADLLAEALTEMPVSTLVEVVAAFKRVEAWAVGQAAAAAAELATRPEMNPLDRMPVPTGAGRASGLRASVVAGTELALRLGISRASARRLVGIGTAVNGALSATGEALAHGLIDWTKAGVIADGVTGVPWQVAQAVEDAVLSRAPRRTANQLRGDVAAALQAVDPEDADRRHRRARAGRKVDHPQPLPDGMALIRAVLPADAAVRLDATLHAAATGAKAGGDPRTVDQLRADALDALTTHAWRLGALGGSASDDRVGGGASSESGLGALVALLGPFATSASRERMRLPHIGRPAQVNVTVDLTTLMGLTDNPGTISGYGPVPAGLARDLARDATWRRLVTDPVSGAVLDVATRRYRPPANLAELARLRHPACVNPICSVPAHACDTDHHRPWTPSDPDTSAANLGPLCRTDHLLKTHAGYLVRRVLDTIYEITTPTGHRYRTVDPPTGSPNSSESIGRPPPF